MAENMLGITESLFGARPASFQSEFAAALPALKGMSATDIGAAATLAGARQLGRGLMSAAGVEDPEMASANRAKQFAVELQQQGVSMQSSQGMKMLAQKLSEAGDFKAAQAAAALGSQFENQEATIGLKQAQTQKLEMAAGQEEQLRSELQALGPNATQQQIMAVVSKYGSPDRILATLQASQDRQDRLTFQRDALAAKGTGDGVGKLTTAQKAVDSKFGKEYADFYAGGGINNLKKNLEELDRAIAIIEKAEENEVSGKVIGLSDKAGTLAYTHSKAADVKDIIGGVAQSNLRQILGGQFAQKEGEALLARQYDTAQSKQKNLNRLRALRRQAANTIQSKQTAAEYFEENGTLKDFKGTQSISDDKDPLGLRK
jgi:hypothetical protein